MKYFYIFLILCGLCISPLLADKSETIKFIPLHVYIDSGSQPLAAYQFELNASDNVKIVGIEGGQHPSFNSPPYYDTKAIMNQRIIIADYSTNQDLPTGKSRIATLHLQVSDTQTPYFETQLTIAGNENGQPIDGIISTERGE